MPARYCLSALALMLAAAPAFAEPDTKPKEPVRTEQVIIIKQRVGGAEGKDAPAPGEKRVMILSDSCGGSETLTDIDAQSGKERSRVILCTKGKENSAMRVEALARARAELAKDENLGGELKAKVLAQLDSEIAKLKAEPAAK